MLTSRNASRVDNGTVGVFCVCAHCRLHRSWDPVAQALVEGRYVGDNERKHHIRADRGAAIAALHVRFRPPSQTSAPQKTARSDHDYPSVGSAECSAPAERDSLKLALPDSAIKRLLRIEERLKDGNGALPDTSMTNTFLVFRNPPNRDCRPMESPENHALSLQEGISSNLAFLEQENWLESARSFVQDIRLIVMKRPDYLTDLEELGMRIDHKIELQERFKMSHWEVQRMEACRMSENVKVSKTNRYMATGLVSTHPVAIACYVLIAFMNLICGTSLRTCRLLICALRIAVTNSTDGGIMSKQFNIPNDPRSVISFLNLEPSTKPFICCPKCFEIYPFNPAAPNESPAICTFKPTPGSEVCNEPLRKKVKKGRGSSSHLGQEEPVRLYLYHELHDWVANLFSRPDIESCLDNSLLEHPIDKDSTWDILDTPEFRSFEGPESEPKLPFLRRQGSEGRLIFSLNMDGFNPFTNKESGKKVSTCAIYMICLNLPPAIRYNVENVFLVGIIPRPQEPSKEQINPLLRPLVDDLLVMWHHGFFLTSTHNYSNGRLVRGAVIPLVCDLPAARQMSGFSNHSSSNFCSVCKLKGEDINNFDYKTWSPKNDQEHRRLAKLWKNAASERRQAELYEFFGVRWSELLRLPYWDAPRYTVIDSMHAFLLRILQRHMRQIMGMSVDFEDGDGPSVELLEKDKPSYSVMMEARKILRTEPEIRLEKLKVDALRELSHAAGLCYSGVKHQLVKQLMDYRIQRGWFDEDGNMIGDGSDGLPEPKKTSAGNGALLNKLPSDNARRKNRPVDDPPTPEELERGLELLEYGHKRKISTLRKALLKHLCDLKEIDYPKDCKGPELVDRIENWRINSGIVDSEGHFIRPKESDNLNKKGTKVLGRKTLEEVRADMERLILPSWVARAPSQPGTAKQGKFTADQWRSFCLINLTFTLTRLWGLEPKNSRKRRMLDNFLHLVTAIKISSMRTMTSKRIEDYTFHMHKYLTTLLDLYPGATISPYQHMALHFQSFLERFGPTHSWRCFPFERYNFLLQNIPTNMKFGDLETTMFRKFCMGQNLRHLFKSSKLPPELDDLVLTWEKQYKADIRGTLRGDTLAFNESYQETEETETWKPRQLEVLPEIWYLYLQNWLRMNDTDCDLGQLSRYAFLRNKISRLGETYRTQATSLSEGNIYYKESDESWSAGAIQAIFSHTRRRKSGTSRTQTFLIVNQYRPLPEDKIHLDHFRSYSFVAGKLYQDSFFQGSAIISVAELLCHFGRGDFELPEAECACFVALPLDRL